jgi:hypothetical protein
MEQQGNNFLEKHKDSYLTHIHRSMKKKKKKKKREREESGSNVLEETKQSCNNNQETFQANTFLTEQNRKGSWIAGLCLCVCVCVCVCVSR